MIPRPGPGAALSKLLARGKTRGWSEVGRLGIDRLKEEIHSQDVLIFFLRLTAEPSPFRPDEKTAGLEVVRAEASHADRYERDIGTDSAETFRSRLTEVSRCYLVVDGDRILHASWVATGASWIRELRRYFKPPPDSAYIYESFTRADARGRGVYPLALKGMSEGLADDDLGTAWVAVEEDNPPSLRSITKAGFEEAFRISYRRRMGFMSVGPPVGPHTDRCPGCFSKKIAR